MHPGRALADAPGRHGTGGLDSALVSMAEAALITSSTIWMHERRFDSRLLLKSAIGPSGAYEAFWIAPERMQRVQTRIRMFVPFIFTWGTRCRFGC